MTRFVLTLWISLLVAAVTCLILRVCRERNLRSRWRRDKGDAGLQRALSLLRRRSTVKVEKQVADLCYQLSSGLKCGQSLFQALDDASRNLPLPLGATINSTIAYFKTGSPLLVAMTESCRSLGCEELRQVVRVLSLVEMLGSDPGTALERAARAAESRLEMRSLLDSKLAEVRLSAYIVMALPVLLSATGFVLQPGLIIAAMASSIGRAAYLIGAVLWVTGTAAVWRLSHPVWA